MLAERNKQLAEEQFKVAVALSATETAAEVVVVAVF